MKASGMEQFNRMLKTKMWRHSRALPQTMRARSVYVNLQILQEFEKLCTRIGLQLNRWCLCPKRQTMWRCLEQNSNLSICGLNFHCSWKLSWCPPPLPPPTLYKVDEKLLTCLGCGGSSWGHWHQKDGGGSQRSWNMLVGLGPAFGGSRRGPLWKPCQMRKRNKSCQSDQRSLAFSPSPTGWPLLGQTLGFAWCCKTQATLSAK